MQVHYSRSASVELPRPATLAGIYALSVQSAAIAKDGAFPTVTFRKSGRSKMQYTLQVTSSCRIPSIHSRYCKRWRFPNRHLPQKREV
ncbi:hypothetical protein LLO_3137 [Legionella longbeachae NSW150]|uniref:Uncharacterized protein n=1 Tax=Legionella longbeachae serogroup 1 (strain NSW150) TaxID=661367 RepID=D3HMA0_LEGLN|nr:hypothetical protein LLO_3137 [Legionella longbeachae NSW150]